MKLGSIEAGGTKFVCAVGNKEGKIDERIVLPTETPERTIPAVIDFFRGQAIEAIGIGSFGPVDIKKTSPTYGHILNTPKLAWRGFPILQTIRDALGIPAAFTTDVNAAALGELVYGAGRGRDSLLYITVGTGIGAGAVVSGRLLEGFSHPEMGHIYVRRHPDDPFAGACPYHLDCLEGLASGPAIEKRWGKRGIELSGRREVWELEAYYIAEALAQYISILVPEKIIIGGGVSKQRQIFPLIREKVRQLLNGYFSQPEVNEKIDEYIVPPGLGDHAGIIGGLVLALRELQK